MSNKNAHYICECGKEFDNPQKFNGHKRHCKIHLKAVHKVEEMQELDKRQRQHQLETKAKNKIAREVQKETKQQQELEQWISEKHTCEKCGKLMTEKYASGRFCCRACANSKIHSAESRRKTSETLRNTSSQSLRQQRHRKQLEESKVKNREAYAKNPRHCQSCGQPLS